LHGVAVVWLAEFVDEAACLLDDDSWNGNDCSTCPYPCKLIEAAVVRRNNRHVTDRENSNMDPWATETVD
jgi:hypothetical protein